MGGGGGVDFKGQKRTHAWEQGQTNSTYSCLKACLSCGTPQVTIWVASHV